MLRGSVSFVLALALVSCGAEPIEPAQLGEVCGVDGPFRLLSIEPDRRWLGRLLPFAERYIYTTVRREVVDDHVEYTDVTAWSVGTCGGSPRRLADGVSSPSVNPRWPDVLLGCREEAREIVALDPEGVLPPHVVFAGVGCSLGNHPWGIINLAAEDADDPDSPATLSVLPYPDDPRSETAAPVVLLAPNSHPQYPLSRHSSMRVGDDELFILTTDGSLLHVSLPDGAITVEQTDVEGFRFSKDERYLVYQVTSPTSTDPPGEGPIFLRDRTTGAGQLLAQSDLRYYANFADDERGLFFLTLPDNALRVYALPGLDFVDLPPGLRLIALLADGRWLLKQGFDGPIHLVDPDDPEAIMTLFGGGIVVQLLPDGILALDVPQCCLTPESLSAEGGLWFVPYDGSAPERIAERMSNDLRYVDTQRLLAAVNIDVPDEVADIILVDLEKGTEQLVAEGVWRPGFGFVGALDDGILSYTLVDDDRSEVWLARLPEVR